MPTYDYVCTKCGTVKEVFHTIADVPSVTCDEKGCRGSMRKSYAGAGPYIHPNAIPTRKNNSGVNSHLRKSKQY